MKKVTKIFVLFLFVFTFSTTANASTKAWFGLNLANLKVTPAQSNSSGGSGIGFGLSYEIAFASLGIDLGLSYNIYKFTSGGSAITSKFLTIPLFFRYHFLPVMNIGLGPYYQLALGNPTVDGDSTQTWASLGYKSSELGLGFVLGGKIPLGAIALLLDLRYNFSLANYATTSTPSAKWSNFQILAGLAF